MNMLARALYGDMSWQGALDKTLAAPSPKMLSGGGTADKCNQPYRKHSKHAWVTYRLAVQSRMTTANDCGS